MTEIKKCLFLSVIFFTIASGLFAQTESSAARTSAVEFRLEADSFPAAGYWAMDLGFGMSDILVRGTSFQLIIDPKIWISPRIMLGSKTGVNYSIEDEASNILTFEGQVYFRWNMLHLGKNPRKKTSVFLQGGLGLISAYRGEDSPFDDVTRTRGSLMGDAALGATIPLSPRLHIEPSIRGGYPHIAGFSFTAGYKFPLPQRINYQFSTRTEYVEIIKMLPPEEIIKVLMISQVDYILFGPNIGKYNIGVEHDARELNEMVLDSTAQILKDNPDFRVRVEGHANPITNDPNEADELMALSALRSNAVADELRARGVSNDQMVIISFGGTRNITGDQAIWDRNRRVELMIIQVDAGQN